MSQKDNFEDIKDIESELGVRLRPKGKIPEGAAITFEAIGKKYPKFSENVKDDIYQFLIKRRGILGILYFFGFFGVLVWAAYDFPSLDLVVFLSPLILIFDYIAAKVLTKRKRRPILEVQIERSAVPASLTLSGDGKRLDTVMLDSKITGWDLHWVYEEAITDSPKPGSLHIPEFKTIPHIKTNAKMGIIENSSDDGTFGISNPFQGFNSIFMLNAYQRPKVLMSRDYEKKLDRLTKMKGLDIQTVKELKERDQNIRELIGKISVLANEQRATMRANKEKVRRVLNLDVKFDRFLTNLDKSNIPWWKDYEEAIQSPEHLTKNDLIDIKNIASSIVYQGKSLNDVLPKIHHKVRIEEHIDRQQIEDIDVTAALNAAKIDMEKTGAPKTSLILRRADESYSVDDTEEDD